MTAGYASSIPLPSLTPLSGGDSHRSRFLIQLIERTHGLIELPHQAESVVIFNFSLVSCLLCVRPGSPVDTCHLAAGGGSRSLKAAGVDSMYLKAASAATGVTQCETGAEN